MYKSLEEICEMTTKEGKPFWKIVQEDDCKESPQSEPYQYRGAVRHGVPDWHQRPVPKPAHRTAWKPR